MTQLRALAEPFPAKYIEPAPSGYGTFVGHDLVTQRLLMDLGAFDFRVIEIVKSPDGIIEGCLAALTVTVDGREVTIVEVGDCDNPLQKKTQGDRLKNAASDAIKRCAMRLGVALHLWSGDNYFLAAVLAKRETDNAPRAKPGYSSVADPAGAYDPDDPERPYIARQNTSLPLDTAPV